MTKLQKKFATAIATGALLLNTALPAFAGVTIEISGNGADSENEAEVEVEQSTVVVQSNTADIYNSVHASADTGGNEAEDNTGGAVSIETGDAETTVDVTNQANSNAASVDCCNSGDVDVLISGNGADSENEVEVEIEGDKGSGTSVFQDNVAEITNKVWADSDTGDNEAEGNTGGDVSIETGTATVGVTLVTSANANSARVGGGSEGTSSLSARIIGNGADSENEIELELEKELLIAQSNFADIYNKVDADAETGDNEAEENTGGAVSIETGDAEVTVGIDNMVNFNWADVDCGGCLFDILAKIAGNGEDSENEIEFELEDELEVFQGNCHIFPVSVGNNNTVKCDLDNKVYADADTGDNEVEDSTGDPGQDPTIETGDGTVDVQLENTGNANVFGETPEWELPDWMGGFSINISLDLSALLELLGLV